MTSRLRCTVAFFYVGRLVLSRLRDRDGHESEPLTMISHPNRRGALFLELLILLRRIDDKPPAMYGGFFLCRAALPVCLCGAIRMG